MNATARTISRVERMMRLGTEETVDVFVAALALAEANVMELAGACVPAEFAGRTATAQAWESAARIASLSIRVSGAAYTGPGYEAAPFRHDGTGHCRCAECR